MKERLLNDNHMEQIDLHTIVQQEIPDGRTQLEQSHSNLEKVAAYCEAHYFQAADKRAALEETRRYAIQSLASVSYQINGLANNMLCMLDAQANRLNAMAAKTHELDQLIKIHKEKAARREIGQLTTSKVVSRQYKIVQPSEPEHSRRYQRHPIDFTLLDGIGHGVRSAQPQVIRSGYNTIGHASIARTESSASSGSHKLSGSLGNAQGQRAAATLSRGSSQRAMPPGVAMYGQYNQSQAPVYSINNAQPVGHGHYAPNMPQLAVNTGDAHFDDMPPPPSPLGEHREESPPLPPPPPQLHPVASMSHNAVLAHNDNYLEPDWVPKVYIEKVVSMYEYDANKPDELSFGENAIIFVLKKNDDGWFEGVCDGVTGLFPGNYVQPCA